MKFTVYVHKTPSNKYYVGITSRSCEKRWKYGYGYKSQERFWRAINKYGWDNIEHIIVAQDLSHDEACRLEISLIAQYQSNNPKYGYNITSGGDGTCDFLHTNPHSDEWRKKVSIANTGKKRTEAAKQKMRNAKLGTHWSEERRLKYSKSQKDRGFKPSLNCIQASNEVRRKAITVFDVHNEFIGNYKSLTDAAKDLNVSVSYLSIILSGKQKSNKFIIVEEKN